MFVIFLGHLEQCFQAYWLVLIRNTTRNTHIIRTVNFLEIIFVGILFPNSQITVTFHSSVLPYWSFQMWTNKSVLCSLYYRPSNLNTINIWRSLKISIQFVINLEPRQVLLLETKINFRFLMISKSIFDHKDSEDVFTIDEMSASSNWNFCVSEWDFGRAASPCLTKGASTEDGRASQILRQQKNAKTEKSVFGTHRNQTLGHPHRSLFLPTILWHLYHAILRRQFHTGAQLTLKKTTFGVIWIWFLGSRQHVQCLLCLRFNWNSEIMYVLH